MEFVEFSKKQRQAMSWWMDDSPYKNYNGIICDGSIRSGKTVCETLGFFLWAMHCFHQKNFICAGKTIHSFDRNVWSWVKPLLFARGYLITEKRDRNLATINYGLKENYFYIFGGKDESSQDLIQGITAAGALFDEVALMPESFVNQATGRCSVTGSKFWFNCNPEEPTHWFKEKWIDKALDKKLLYLHFTMDDNLSLSNEIKERYKSLYTGVFFKRYILGQWVMAEGVIYDMFSVESHCYEVCPQDSCQLGMKWVSIDYGTTNPLAGLLCIDDEKDVWIDSEYYFDSKKEGYQKTDEQYVDDLEKWLTDLGYIDEVMGFVVDPSAASFILTLKQRGYRVIEADNSVLDGIRNTSTMLYRKLLHINKKCINLIKEIQGYVWEPNSDQKEKPKKVKDHACDSLRYFIKTKIPQWRFTE